VFFFWSAFESKHANADDFAADPNALETWMNEWMNQWVVKEKKPIGALFLGRFKDPIYFLRKPIKWTPNQGQKDYQPVVVPAGFVTDFASIPRAFWSLYRPDGEYTYPAIVHDYLYWTQERPKDEADQILRLGMEDFGIDSFSLNSIYQAVHQLGGSSWDANTKLRGEGEMRILAEFPDDPTISWGIWKMKPGVFAKAK